ncbi:MAG: IS110 family transposase [Anaerolineaceae bacterium]|nr:IS110 family transposase [Anaerolineaceae bacterium]
MDDYLRLFHNKGNRWPDVIPIGISEDTPADKQSAIPLLIYSIKQVDTVNKDSCRVTNENEFDKCGWSLSVRHIQGGAFYYVQCWNRRVKGKEHGLCDQAARRDPDGAEGLQAHQGRSGLSSQTTQPVQGRDPHHHGGYRQLYHLPVCQYLKSKDYQIAIINPLEMKRYRCQGIRNPKTDRIDSLIIAQYGIDYWYRFKPDDDMDEKRKELRLLGKQYTSYMRIRTIRCQDLCHILERTMPGVYGLLDDFNRNNGQDKLCDFAEKYWHSGNITKYSEKIFVERYNAWLKKKGYRSNGKEARQLYSIARNAIPTLDSKLSSTKLLVQEAVNVLREVDSSLYDILNQLKTLSKVMPEYETVLAMKGIGETLDPRFIAEIGDPRRFHSAKALIAYAGIDAPPYQSGQFTGTRSHISKRGSANLRKLGYELMDSINKHKSSYIGDPVCEYFMKKRNEGKPYRVAMIATFNKFLRIYHSRISEVLNENENNHQSV